MKAPAWSIAPADADYPDALTQLDEPRPPRLHGLGDRSLLERVAAEPAVTIVGSRRASSYGLRVAATLAGDLARAGVVVISGMALGIDGAAHRGALEAGGPTLAVLACGPDVAYPAVHRSLHGRIAATGAVISEHPPGWPARRFDFPARNRFMAALATVVVIVEAAQPSGSMITADVAGGLGRTVGAVPGQIGVRSAEGCNDLIASGAHLIRGSADVLDLLFGVGVRSAVRTGPPLESDLASVLDRVESGAATVDALVAAGGLEPREAAVAIARLELLGYVSADPLAGFARTGLARGHVPDGPL